MKCVYCQAEWSEPLCPACRHGLETYYKFVKDGAARQFTTFQRHNGPLQNMITFAPRAIECCAALCGVNARDLICPKHHKAFAHPRHAAIWLIAKYTLATLDEIGTYFGSRDHSTVVCARRAVEAEVAQGDGPRARIVALAKKELWLCD